MKKEITITFEWWNLEGDIKPEHQEVLEDDAKERIFEQIQEGFTSGELHSFVRTVNEEGDGMEYEGSWSLTTKTL